MWEYINCGPTHCEALKLQTVHFDNTKSYRDVMFDVIQSSLPLRHVVVVSEQNVVVRVSW